jgi:hypothetical protein
MARRRYVSTDISDDDAIAELVRRRGYLAALFYTWLIPHADDQCNLPAHSPKKLLSIVMPQLALMTGNRRVKEDDLGAALDDMVDLGLLEREDDGHYHFPEASFYRYQTYVPEAKRRSAAFVGVERRSSALSGETSAYPSINPSPTPSPSSPPTATAAPLKQVLLERPTIFKHYEDLFGRGVSGLIAERLKEYETTHSPECVLHCFVEAAESNARSVKLLYDILDRHKNEGCHDKRPQRTNPGQSRTLARANGQSREDRVAAQFAGR